jgi:hypothetical protein
MSKIIGIENVLGAVKDILDKDEQVKNSVGVEVIGSWVWVSGDTKQIKDELKLVGFLWSNKKLSWYNKCDGDNKIRRSGFYKNLDDLREAKGSVTVTL